MEQEAIEGDSGWKVLLNLVATVKSQSNNMDLRSQSPKFSKCFSLNTKSVASSLEDLHFDAQFRKQCQGFTDRQKQAQSQATGLLLQDCETGAAGMLLKHCRPDKFIAANNLASSGIPVLFPDFVQWRHDQFPRCSMMFHQLRRGAARGSRKS